MQYIPEKSFFLTYPRSSHTQYFCTFNESLNSYDKYIYFPTKFETLSQNQIHRYRQNFVRRFLFWSLRNQSKLTLAPEDRRIVFCRAFDLNSQILSFVLVGVCLNKLFSYIKAPFLDLMLEGTGISTLAIKRLVAIGIVGYGSYKAIKNISDSNYLFDLAMKYKEEFAPKELLSPNCEATFEKHTGKV